MRFWVGLLIVFCLSGVAKADAMNEDLAAEVIALRERVIQLEARQMNRDFLEGEARRLRVDAAGELASFIERVDRERENFLGLLMRSLTIVGIGVSVLGVLFGRDYWKIRRELDSWAREQVESTATELKDEAERTIRGHLKLELHAIDDELRHLRRVVNREVRYRTVEVALVADKKELESLTDTEAVAIEARGLNIAPVELGTALQSASFKNIDLIVYRYEKDGDSEKHLLTEFLQRLSREFGSIDVRPPVIIYTPERHVVSEAIGEYGMATFANSLPALVSNVLVQAFFLLRTEERTS